jgi:hypothetical protein
MLPRITPVVPTYRVGTCSKEAEKAITELRNSDLTRTESWPCFESRGVSWRLRNARFPEGIARYCSKAA